MDVVIGIVLGVTMICAAFFFSTNTLVSQVS